ncbi:MULTISPECIES: universal stress protein [Micrococcaceae]|uniref:Universal stress protein n=1 Tax=Paenarthrobacter aromaticivorans TaxID=2849150 RepID=A0ABS6I5U8_9MICC|nr:MULTISPECIES: universal stress protein [Micrococcaceae]MBU8865807.1 universal stress protein [Paenarthrobacter sp. MMS21-TAE1-1]
MKKQIVAALDGSKAGRNVADWAAAHADAFGLALNLVHVVPPDWAFPARSERKLAIERAEDLLGSESGRIAQAYPGLEVSSTQLSGEPAETLAGLSSEADMLVAGTDRGPGTEGQGYGSVSFQIAVTSNCPVAVVPEMASGVRKGVVVGVDGSSDSLVALDLAASEAQRMDEDLVIVHASGPDPRPSSVSGDSDVLADAVRNVKERHPGVSVRERLDTSRGPGEALVAAARDARLLVMGCRGRGGLRVLLGSVAQHVLLNVQCPTILTRPS